jgi:hypothetical protein
MSDWGIENVKEVVNYYIEQDGRDNSPFLDLEKQWETKIDHYLGMLKRARVRRAGLKNLNRGISGVSA